jgi:Mn-containing catalase
MFLRIDKLPWSCASPEIDPVAAKMIQEFWWRFGEMSTLMNYTFQSFNMRGRDQIRLTTLNFQHRRRRRRTIEMSAPLSTRV